MKYWRRRALIIIGNFGMDFLKPLIGINLGIVAFGVPLTPQVVLWSSFIAASIGAGLSTFRELVAWGEFINGRKQE